MVDAVRTTTLEVLRRRVSRALGDLVQVKSTLTGTPATLIDQVNIPTGAETLNRRQMIFTSGTFRGNQVVITNTDHAANQITFSPPQSGNVVAGVTADIFNRNGMGYPPIAIDDAINEAIDDSYPLARTTVSTTVTYADATGYIVMPSTMDQVYAIEYYDPRREEWVAVLPSPYRTRAGWQPDIVNGRLYLSGDLSRSIDGYQVMVTGEGRHAQLSLFSDTTKLDPEWIVPTACYILIKQGLNYDDSGNRARMIQIFQTESEAKKASIRTRHQPFSAQSRS